jgi:hypothetical protein
LAYLWWQSGKDRWKTLACFLVVVAASILIYGPWPVWFVNGVVRISLTSQYKTWNSSIGLWALPLFIPAFRLKLTPYQRVVALTATGLLVSPYMPYYSTIPLLCFAVPWWSALFAFLGYFPTLIGTGIAWNGIVFFPITVLAWLYWPFLKKFLLARKGIPQLDPP